MSNNISFNFQRDFSFDIRKAECERVREKHPNKIPIVCEIHPKDIIKQNTNHHQPLIKSKYLVNEDFTIAQFTQVIRGKMKLDKNVAIFIIVCGQMVSSSQTIRTLYARYRNSDGFLYITYCFENVFG